MQKASGKCEVSAAFAKDTGAYVGTGAAVRGSISSFLVKISVAAGTKS